VESISEVNKLIERYNTVKKSGIIPPVLLSVYSNATIKGR